MSIATRCFAALGPAAATGGQRDRRCEREEGYHSSVHAFSFQKNWAPQSHAGAQVVSPCGRNGEKPIQTWRLGPGASNL